MGLARTVTRNTLVQLAGETGGKLATLAFYVVMARQLGRGGFGDFTFALSLALLLTAFAGLGTDAILARETARRQAHIHDLFWNAIAIKTGMCALAVASAGAVAVAGGYDRKVQIVVVLLGVASSVEVLSKTVYATFQGLEDMRPVAASRMLQRITIAAIGISALAAGAGVIAVGLIYLAGALVALAWAAWRLALAGVRPRRRVSLERALRLATQSIPIGLASAIGMVLFRIDATLLSVIKGNDVVGLYGAAYRLLDATLFFSIYFVAAMLPALSRLDRTTKPTVAEAYEGAAKVQVIVLAPVAATFVLFADPLIKAVYGAKYAEAGTAMRLLGATVLLYGISYLSGYVLVARGRQRVMPWITGAVTVENVVLNLIFIPRYSLNAAAAVTTVSEATLALATAAFALRAAGGVSLRRVAAGPVLGCAVIGAVAALTEPTLTSVFGGLVAYALTLLAFERAAFPADVRVLADSLQGRGVAIDGTPSAGGPPVVESPAAQSEP